jgi:hypothetical protein
MYAPRPNLEKEKEKERKGKRRRGREEEGRAECERRLTSQILLATIRRKPRGKFGV